MTIISHKYKFVFLHIPKTGGSYVLSKLKKIDDEYKEILYYNDDTSNKINNLYGHLHINNVKMLNIYENIKNYTFFTIIRNPINLIKSHYNYTLTCKNLHYRFKDLDGKNINNCLDILLNDSNYYNYVNDNNINVKCLIFENLNIELFDFLSKINVSNEKLNLFLDNKPVNVSEKHDDELDLKLLITHIINNNYNLLDNMLFYIKTKYSLNSDVISTLKNYILNNDSLILDNMKKISDQNFIFFYNLINISDINLLNLHENDFLCKLNKILSENIYIFLNIMKQI